MRLGTFLLFLRDGQRKDVFPGLGAVDGSEDVLSQQQLGQHNAERKQISPGIGDAEVGHDAGSGADIAAALGLDEDDGDGLGARVRPVIGDYFAACMDEAAIEKAGAKPLADTLKRIERIKSKQDLVKAMAELGKQGVRGAYGAAIFPDQKKSDEYASYLDGYYTGEDGKLLARAGEDEWFRLYPASAWEFFATENSTRWTFVKTPDGMVREVVARSLRELERSGAIQVNKRQIHIVDHSVLLQWAE